MNYKTEVYFSTLFIVIFGLGLIIGFIIEDIYFILFSGFLLISDTLIGIQQTLYEIKERKE